MSFRLAPSHCTARSARGHPVTEPTAGHSRTMDYSSQDVRATQTNRLCPTPFARVETHYSIHHECMMHGRVHDACSCPVAHDHELRSSL